MTALFRAAPSRCLPVPSRPVPDGSDDLRLDGDILLKAFQNAPISYLAIIHSPRNSNSCGLHACYVFSLAKNTQSTRPKLISFPYNRHSSSRFPNASPTPTPENEPIDQVEDDDLVVIVSSYCAEIKAAYRVNRIIHRTGHVTMQCFSNLGVATRRRRSRCHRLSDVDDGRLSGQQTTRDANVWRAHVRALASVSNISIGVPCRTFFLTDVPYGASLIDYHRLVPRRLGFQWIKIKVFGKRFPYSCRQSLSLYVLRVSRVICFFA